MPTSAQLRLLADVEARRVTRHAGEDLRQGKRINAQMARLIAARLVRLVRLHDFLSRYELTDAGRAALGEDAAADHSNPELQEVAR